MKKGPGRPKLDVKRSERLPTVRITDEQLLRYRDAAKKASLSLGEWVRRVLDKSSQ